MSQSPSSLQRFFAEMKRRRVFKVMAVYGAVAFAALQLADLFVEPLGLPAWTMTFLLLVAMVGFPIAIVLAWAFETTPQGMRRTEVAAPEEIRAIVSAPRRHRWPAGLLALAGMTLLFATGWWMGAGRDAGGPVGALVPEAQAADLRTLAALPFENVNGDEENRIMAIGLLDDLLAQLSRIEALRVTSRTSVNEYADTDKTLHEIAGELGVDYVLEGSVRRSGDRVRVSVTLVDAARDEQMWTQQYDNEVTPDNLFDIQSDIARQVVSELRAQLTPEDEDRLETLAPASDLAAQSWYYRGIDVYKNSSLDEIKAARDYLARAVAIDSTYTVAWSWLAQVESRLVFIGDGELDQARAAMERTVALAPQSLEAHLARGFFEYYGQGNYDAARSAFEAAVRLAPSDADAAWALALILRRQGEWDESTKMMKRAAELDPRNSLRLETLSENLAWAGAFEVAAAIVDRSLTLDPANSRARSRKVEYLIEQDGATERAHRMADELALDPTSFEEQTALTKLALFDRRPEQVLEITGAVDRTGSPFLTLQLLIARAQALAELGNPRVGAVVDSLRAIQNSSPGAEVDHPARVGFAEALAGRRELALADLGEAERMVREWPDHVLNTRWAYMTAGGFGAIGELDAGFSVLDDAVERPSMDFSATSLRLDPVFDPYREDPRFDAIVQRRDAFEAKGARMSEAGRPWLP